MNYSQADMTHIEQAIQATTSKHVKILADMMRRNSPYIELFDYGMRYLPRIRDKKTGKIDLDRLNGFVPQVVSYFHALSEIPSMPEGLKNVATDFAAYADGESVQTDGYYFKLDPESELKKALLDLE